MSRKNNSKQEIKMLPQSQPLKKKVSSTTSTLISQSRKTSVATTKATSSPKDEEKSNRFSVKPGVVLTSKPRTSKRELTKSTDTKPSTSRSKITSLPTNPRLKPRSIADKQIKTPLSKQTSSGVKSVTVSRPASSRTNLVMNTVHNVTVSSPPSKRKDPPIPTITEKEETRPQRKSRNSNVALEKSPNLETKNTNRESIIVTAENSAKVKEPVAFEVVFDEDKKARRKSKNSNSPFSSEQGDYSDDFESYESDFETGSSSEVESRPSSSSKANSTDDRESPPLSAKESDLEEKSDIEDESELTHVPITVIHREKEVERKLDSGHYDLNSKKNQAVESFDSFDTLVNTEQLDSGISYENNVSNNVFDEGSVVFGGYIQFFRRPKLTKRGSEIMSKIQFDSISFTLLDLKPFPYNTYMKMFGNSYTVQSGTQTSENRMENECQTDENEMRSIWTQHPPFYSFDMSQGSLGFSQCSGENLDCATENLNLEEDKFDNTIQALSKLRRQPLLSTIDGHNKSVQHIESLNRFLISSSEIVSRILSTNGQDPRLEKNDLPNRSKGYFKLNTSFLNALRVVRIFANIRFNLILTVHESIEKVYEKDFSNLIMVWSCEDSEKPMRLLSTWSEVSRAEICNNSPDIIVSGLRDGSIAMWDLRETYSFCSKLDGYLTHFAATHSIAPSWGGADMQSFDVGAVIDVKSFRLTKQALSSEEKFKNIQFASLNETGLLAIWTLVEVNSKNYQLSQNSDSKFEYSSPWARMKLIQSAICDLREYIELGSIRPKSAFDCTKSNFQKDVFNDEILKELAETQNDQRLGVQGLRFINLECGKDLIYIGTNRNFIISCSKTLKKERFRKINIVRSGFLFPTTIRLLENEDFLAVGLSNGSIMILNCNQENNFEKRHIKSSQNPGGTVKTPNEIDFEVGKSCAIQNIIQNERRPMSNDFMEDDFRPNTAVLVTATLEEGKKPYELRIFDEQVLLSGSVLRKDLVQNLELSSDNWMLFALSDGRIRSYDFSTETEVPFYESDRSIKGIAACRGQGNEKYVILLDSNINVQVHLLKD